MRCLPKFNLATAECRQFVGAATTLFNQFPVYEELQLARKLAKLVPETTWEVALCVLVGQQWQSEWTLQVRRQQIRIGGKGRRIQFWVKQGRPPPLLLMMSVH